MGWPGGRWWRSPESASIPHRVQPVQLSMFAWVALGLGIGVFVQLEVE